MTTRTIVVCDGCGAQLELKGCAGPLNVAEYARELHMYGWRQSLDAERDYCPNHPAPVDA